MIIDEARARRLLTRPRISIVTSHPDAEVARLQALLGDHLHADGRNVLEQVLGQLTRAAEDLYPAPKTLDLIGHATADGLLRIGDWVIDGHSPVVTAFFRNIADAEVLPRIGATSLRLLGCSTAVTPRARGTLRILSELLGMEVYGTVGPIYSLHYDAAGFSHHWRFMLSEASEARDEPARDSPAAALPTRRTLDIDGLPSVPITEVRAWPRHIISHDTARAVLELVDRSAGAQMPGLLAIPSHDLALPAHRDGDCHLAEVILDGQFLRVYPDGDDQPGIVYPVSAPDVLFELLSDAPTV
jgi:hypothetical protein